MHILIDECQSRIDFSSKLNSTSFVDNNDTSLPPLWIITFAKEPSSFVPKLAKFPPQCAGIAISKPDHRPKYQSRVVKFNQKIKPGEGVGVMLHYFPSIFPANYEIVISKHASRYQSDELLHCKLISNAFRVRGIAISGREIAHIDTEITRYKIRPSLPLPRFRNFDSERERERTACSGRKR